MTRIGFAYNQKPEPVVALRSPSDGTIRAGQRPGELAVADDEFAEWDTPETIAAVESALSSFGEVIRLEADEPTELILVQVRLAQG